MSIKKISCSSCRSRKLKCDGYKPCKRCQSKNIDCIYTKPGQVGRPPKKALVNKFVHTHTNSAACREFVFEHTNPIPRQIKDSTMQGFGHYLKYIYTHRFLFKPAVKEYRQIMVHKEDYQTKIEDITHFFVSMSSDMSIILMHHLSALRLPNAHYTEYISLMISRDPTTAFFDSNTHQPVLSNPINSLPSHQALCLIDTFFHIHPHSFMLSKSELLKSYWSDTTDPLLLSVIYGSTLFMSRIIDGQSINLFETHNLEIRNPFLDYAHQLLSQLPEEVTVSRYQAVVLLGMFEAMYGYSKKGVSLFILSYIMVEKLGLFDPSVSQTPLQKELLGITFWSVFQCTARGYVERKEISRQIIFFIICYY